MWQPPRAERHPKRIVLPTQEIVEGMTTAWNRIKDMTDKEAPLPFHAYQKLAAMKQHCIGQDLIFLDEAQGTLDFLLGAPESEICAGQT